MVKRRIVLLLLLLLLLPVGIGAVGSSTNHIIQRAVLVGGGAADSPHFAVTSVIGQPATDVVNSASYRVSGGFLFRGRGNPTYRLRLPLVFR
jgi:hypothetical protein